MNKKIESNKIYSLNCLEGLKNLPDNSIWVAESGITSYCDLEYITKLGFHAALIGTSLMKSKDPGMALAKLMRRVPA